MKIKKGLVLSIGAQLLPPPHSLIFGYSFYLIPHTKIRDVPCHVFCAIFILSRNFQFSSACCVCEGHGHRWQSLALSMEATEMRISAQVNVFKDSRAHVAKPFLGGERKWRRFPLDVQLNKNLSAWSLQQTHGYYRGLHFLELLEAPGM